MRNIILKLKSFNYGKVFLKNRCRVVMKGSILRTKDKYNKNNFQTSEMNLVRAQELNKGYNYISNHDILY